MVKKDNRLVSIIMPAYNAKKTISESINSVINQTYINWELIIVNDCSTDDTTNIVSRYVDEDSRIKLLLQKENGGVAKARNRGIEEAKGEYVAFLDSDDFWDPNKLKKQIEFMEENNYLFSFTDVSVVNEKSEIINKRTAPSEITYKKLLKSNKIACLTVVINSDIIKNNLMKDIGHEDYLTWLEILKTGVNAYNVGEILGFYRVSGSSLSGNKKRAATWQWNIYRNELNLNLFSSIYYFINYIIWGIIKII